MKSLKEIWNRIVSMFAVKRERKFYTTYSRRLQLIRNMRQLQKEHIMSVARGSVERGVLTLETK